MLLNGRTSSESYVDFRQMNFKKARKGQYLQLEKSQPNLLGKNTVEHYWKVQYI